MKKGFKRPPFTEEWKKKMSNSRKGKKHSKAWRLKISKSLTGRKLSGEHIEKNRKWHLGRILNSETKIKMKESAKRGKKHHNWQGGSSVWRRKNAPRPEPEQCEVCGAFGKDFKRKLCYDHDHKTNKFRGWLCVRCNFALGMVKDNTEILQALIDYLRK